MTNMSMAVNALQAMVQAHGPTMVAAPTYHVYKMFRPHRDGYLLSCNVESPTLDIGNGKTRSVLSVSATKAADGKHIFVSIVNLDISRPIEIDVVITGGFKVKEVKVEQLTSRDIRDYNSKENPENITPTNLRITVKENHLKLTIPSKSITTFEFRGNDPTPVKDNDARG